MTRKEYIRQLAQEIIRTNQPLIDRIVNQEVDKIKAQLSSLAPNMADRRKMLAVMGTNSSLGVYLANVDKLQGHKSDIATNAFTAPQQAPNPREYFGNEITDSFTRQYFDGDDETNKRISEYFDGDPVFNAAIDEYFNGPKEFRDQLDNYFYMGE
ncbi:TPA: hypothetical protein OL637_002994 [Escherichia coli]|nr:hypothetical protein [Escherichia coli]HCQ7298241.1 hypothetical protein [Escherichia coli]